LCLVFLVATGQTDSVSDALMISGVRYGSECGATLSSILEVSRSSRMLYVEMRIQLARTSQAWGVVLRFLSVWLLDIFWCWYFLVLVYL
jgi:hypothetical protein